MALPFTLSVPLDSRFRVLAPQVAGKFAELMGGGPADAESLAAAVSAAVDRLAAAGHDDGHVDLFFRRGADGLEVELRCNGRTSVLKHLLPAANR